MGFRIFKNNNSRRIGFGLPVILFMGGLIFFSLDSDAVSGCAGDCMTCHPTLADSAEHQSLKTCITCHDPAKPKLKIFSSAVGCGDRCFMCHSQWPQDGAHASLNTCLTCHEK